MKKEEKDIIKHISDTLKHTDDFPYREGAWEKFQQQYADNSPKKNYPFKRWSSVAAALILLGAGAMYFLPKSEKTNPELISNASIHDTQKFENNHPEYPIQEQKNLNIPLKGAHSDDNITEQHKANIVFNEMDYIASSTIGLAEHQSTTELQLINLPVPASLKISDLSMTANPLTPKLTTNEIQWLSSQSIKDEVVLVNNAEGVQSKRVLLNEKFDLGLFVSPNATSEKTNMGGGLMVAYNLSKNISLRTGAAYNTYTVGKLKDPTQASSVEPVAVNTSSSARDMSYSANTIVTGLAAQSNVILPNINAVTGFVRSIDIPLEIKYNVSKSFYATAGASYSAIVNQERNAEYIENVNMETFSNGFPANDSEIAHATKAVTKTVKSLDNNVNTNGFNGFVNFSLGKKVSVKNKFGLSVEPYVKIPVGQYRKSDMDYTNAGLRIMTNF